MSSNGPDLEGLSDGDISEDDNDGGGGEFEDEDASGYASPASSLQGNSSGDTGEGTLRMASASNAGKSNGKKRANSSDGPSGGGRSSVKSKRAMRCLSNANEVLGRRATKEKNREEELSVPWRKADQRKEKLANLETLEKLYRDMGNEAKAKEYLMQRVAILESARNHARARGGPGSAATTGAAAKYFALRRATSSGPDAAAAAAANNAANILAVDSSDSDADGRGNDEFVMDIDGEGCHKGASVGTSGRGCGGGSEGVGAAGGPKRPRCNKHLVRAKLWSLKDASAAAGASRAVTNGAGGVASVGAAGGGMGMRDGTMAVGGVAAGGDMGGAHEASAAGGASAAAGASRAVTNGAGGVASVGAAGGGMGMGDGTMAVGGVAAAAGAHRANTRALAWEAITNEFPNGGQVAVAAAAYMAAIAAQ
ncbi:unnamed protein product [Ectocarpus sp. CCAP 1310/34]|nr:unnamed protein product [Ectocarpus sp. CCAP 1310/34]